MKALNIAIDDSSIPVGVVKYNPIIPEGFTAHDGGVCPLEDGTIYDYIERSGHITTGVPAYKDNILWVHNGVCSEWDVIAYRVVSEPAVVKQPTKQRTIPAAEAPPIHKRNKKPKKKQPAKATTKTKKGQ